MMDTMATADIMGVYKNPYYRDVCIVEMLIDERPDLIDFSSFYCIDKSLPESDWQSVFGERFLSVGLYAEALELPLSTPYGRFALPSPGELSRRLKNVALDIFID